MSSRSENSSLHFRLRKEEEHALWGPGGKEGFLRSLHEKVSFPAKQSALSRIVDFSEDDLTYDDRIVRPIVMNRSGVFVFKGEFVESDPLLRGKTSFRMPCMTLRGLGKINLGDVFECTVRKIVSTGVMTHIPDWSGSSDNHRRRAARRSAGVVEYHLMEAVQASDVTKETTFFRDHGLIREELAVFHKDMRLTTLVTMFEQDTVPIKVFCALPDFSEPDARDPLTVYCGKFPSRVDSRLRSLICEQVRLNPFERKCEVA